MQKNLYFSCTNAFFSLSLHPILLTNPNNLNVIRMEDLKNAVQQEAEKQLKEAQQKAEEQQAAAKKMMEEQTQNVGKAVVKGMALSAVMLVGRKIISSLLGKPGKVGLIAVAIVLCTTACSDNSNDPDNNTTTQNTGGQTGDQINPNDLLGSWYLDSIKSSSGVSSHSQTIVQFGDNQNLLWGTEAATYVVNGNVLSITYPERSTPGNPYVVNYIVLQGSATYAVLQENDANGLIFYFQHLPELTGTELTLSEANMLGKYKYIEEQMFDTKDGETTVTHMYGPGYLQFWQLNTAGDMLFFDNSLNPTSFVWRIDATNKKFNYRVASVATWGDDYNVVSLTSDWLILQTKIYTPAGLDSRFYKEFYLRIH